MREGLASLVLFLLAAIPISVNDLREKRIPNLFLGAALLLALWEAEHLEPGSLPDRLSAAAMGSVLFGCLAAITRGGLGMGDVKLAFVLGAFTGVTGLCLAVFVAAASGLLVALAAMAAGRGAVHARIAFAPFLSLGGLTALLARTVGWPRLLFEVSA